tara:strand:+ start:229 stop:891 length:663 start_codon:yes stop_codon:yes gene_type:complete
MAETINIPNVPNVTDFMAELQDSGKKPVYTPIYPDVYEGRQAIINADRIIFNARLASDQGDKASYAAGGDIHLFSQNFISLSTRGSIHLNTEHPEGLPQEENNVNYIMINAPNIFLGMDDGGEGGLGKPKSYATEPALLGLKNQQLMDKLFDLLIKMLEKLGTENTYVTGAAGQDSSPRKEVWENLIKDWDGEGDSEEGSIGELRKMLRDIKSQHVFIKK